MSLPGPHVIEPVKLTGYLLNMNHAEGRSKAVFFAAHGFDAADAMAFAEALERHARTRPVVDTVTTAGGTKKVVRCRIETPDGRDPCITVVWLQAAEANTYRLITAYPSR